MRLCYGTQAVTLQSDLHLNNHYCGGSPGLAVCGALGLDACSVKAPSFPALDTVHKDLQPILNLLDR